MIVRATRQGIRARVLLNHEDGPVIAEIIDPTDLEGRTIRFRPLWSRNHRTWKDAVADSARRVLDDVLTSQGKDPTATKRR